MDLENEDFHDEDQCQCMYTWELFAYAFFSIRKTSTWNIPTHFFKYSQPSFLIFFFFNYWHHYHYYYLKDYFVIPWFKSAEVFTFVNICQNEGLSEKIELRKWVGIFQVRIFRVVIFWVGFSRGSLMGGNFSSGNCSGGHFHRYIFFR